MTLLRVHDVPEHENRTLYQVYSLIARDEDGTMHYSIMLGTLSASQQEDVKSESVCRAVRAGSVLGCLR